jgi:DNA-binding response OmpR family regulator
VSAPFCPHCGYDLQLDAAILINDFSMMSSNAPLYWRGERISLTDSERILCYTLMRAYPSAVKSATLLDRIDSEATANVIDVFICRIRKKFRLSGAPNVIGTMRPRMYVWHARV